MDSIKVVLVMVFFIMAASVKADITILGRYDAQNDFYYQEDLVFYSCNDGLHYQNEISCENQRPILLESKRWKDECLISSINLKALNCKYIQIRVKDKLTNSYTETMNLNVQKIVPITDSVIATQNYDGSWDTPSETAFNIWVLWNFNYTYKKNIDKALEWLKKVRLNDDKCWVKPYSDSKICSLQETAKVLAHLNLAGFDEAKRVVHDGQAWLNTQQNYIKDNNWKLYLSSSTDTNCSLTYDSTTQFDLDEDEQEEFDITPVAQKKINLTCENMIWALLVEGDGNVVFDVYDYEFKYPIHGGCWNGESWEACDYKSSLYATIATLNSKRKKAGTDYLKSVLRNDEIIGKYLPSNDRIVDTSLYLKYIEDNPSVRSYLVFHQNNDGSWDGANSTSDKVLETLYPTFAFQGKSFKPNQESTSDAREWLLENTPFDGWKNIEKDSLNYLILKDKVPKFITSDKEVIIINNTDSARIELFNPTDYNFRSINFSSKGDATLSASQKINLSGQARQNITITQTDKKDGLFNNIITFSDSDEILKQIPVVVQNNPYIKVTYPKNVFVINNTGKVTFRVDKSASEFDCRLSSNQSVLFLGNNKVTGNSLSVNIIIDDNIRQTIEYVGMLECRSELITEEFAIEMTIEQYPFFPITGFEEINIDKRKQSPEVELENLIDETLDVTVSFEDPMSFHEIEPMVLTFEPYDKKEIKIIQDVPYEINYSAQTRVVVKTLDHERYMKVNIELNDKDFSGQKKGFLWYLMVYGGIILVFGGGLGTAGYFGYKKYKEKKRKKDLEKKAKLDMNSMKSKVSLDDEELELIKVIDKLNQNLQKDEQQIIDQLKDKGFSQEKIDYALTRIKNIRPKEDKGTEDKSSKPENEDNKKEGDKDNKKEETKKKQEPK